MLQIGIPIFYSLFPEYSNSNSKQQIKEMSNKLIIDCVSWINTLLLNNYIVSQRNRPQPTMYTLEPFKIANKMF